MNPPAVPTVVDRWSWPPAGVSELIEQTSTHLPAESTIVGHYYCCYYWSDSVKAIQVLSPTLSSSPTLLAPPPPPYITVVVPIGEYPLLTDRTKEEVATSPTDSPRWANY